MGRLRLLFADNIAVSRSQFGYFGRLDAQQPYANRADNKSGKEAESSGSDLTNSLPILITSYRASAGIGDLPSEQWTRALPPASGRTHLKIIAFGNRQGRYRHREESGMNCEIAFSILSGLLAELVRDAWCAESSEFDQPNQGGGPQHLNVGKK